MPPIGVWYKIRQSGWPTSSLRHIWCLLTPDGYECSVYQGRGNDTWTFAAIHRPSGTSIAYGFAPLRKEGTAQIRAALKAHRKGVLIQAT